MKENLVTSKIARVELGRPGPPLGATFFSAVKRKMGIKSRRVVVSRIRQWLLENQDFKSVDVYPRNLKAERQRCEVCGKLVATRRTAAGVKLRWHHGSDGSVCHLMASRQS